MYVYNKYYMSLQASLTKDVSHSNLLPCSELPMVMRKYELPLLQFDIFVKGNVARISCNTFFIYLCLNYLLITEMSTFISRQ